MPCPNLQTEAGASRATADPDYSRQNSSTSAPIRRIRADPCSIPASRAKLACTGYTKSVQPCPTGSTFVRTAIMQAVVRVFIFVSQRLSSTSRHSERSNQAHRACERSNLQLSHLQPSTFNLPTFNLITFNVQRSTFQPSTFPPSTFNLQPSNLQPSHLQPSTLNSRLTPPPSAPSLRCNPSASRDRGCVR